MTKIRLTESDIVKMVYRAVKALNESKRYGTAYASGSWDPYEALEKAGYNEDQIDGMNLPLSYCYDIKVSQSCTVYDGEDGPGNVADYEGERSFGGEYDKAMEDIEKIPDENLKKVLKDDLMSCCENLDLEEFEEEASPDEWLWETRQLHEYRDPELEFRKNVENGMDFQTKEEYERVAHLMGWDEAKPYEVYITHSDSDRGLIDRPVHVFFFPAHIYYEKDDPSVGYQGRGWVIDEIDWEYGEDEVTSVNGKTVPLKFGIVGWLDEEVNKYCAKHEEEIKKHLYQ